MFIYKRRICGTVPRRSDTSVMLRFSRSGSEQVFTGDEFQSLVADFLFDHLVEDDSDVVADPVVDLFDFASVVLKEFVDVINNGGEGGGCFGFWGKPNCDRVSTYAFGEACSSSPQLGGICQGGALTS